MILLITYILIFGLPASSVVTVIDLWLCHYIILYTNIYCMQCYTINAQP